jgi:hypothetical protein
MRSILLPYVGLGDDFIEGLYVGGGGEQGEQPERREIIYCKRAILSLSSSKILTPPIPLSAWRVSPPPQQRRGVHTRRAERGMGGGVNILEDERDRIALLQ